ncbi:MAG: hypothetical protein FWD64_03780 [Acidobacteriaceae bacterium]|nr:hypothetical protein [Acidobacteriaceae bacterium]
MPIFGENNNQPVTRIKGRENRTIAINTKLTEQENAAVLSAATNAGKTVAEWLRDVALRAAQNAQPDPLFTEIVFCRNALFSLLQQMALKSGITQDAIAKSISFSLQEKHQKAAKAMEQYTQPGNAK